MPMLILLSCAKTMSDVSKTKTPLTTFPGFRKEAAEVALQMSQFQSRSWTAVKVILRLLLKL